MPNKKIKLTVCFYYVFLKIIAKKLYRYCKAIRILQGSLPTKATIIRGK